MQEPHEGEAMSEIRNIGQQMQAEILKTARKSQEAVTGAGRRWTGTGRSIRRTMKDLSLPFADRLRFADRLPKPEELAGNAYEFAQKLLASQRKFAEDVLHAAAPMLTRSSDTGKKDGTGKKSGPASKKIGPAGPKSGPAGPKSGPAAQTTAPAGPPNDSTPNSSPPPTHPNPA